MRADAVFAKLVNLGKNHPIISILGGTIGAYNLYGYLLERFRVTELSKKAVFITGCDYGMGKSAALEMAKLGLCVFAGCLTQEGAESIEKENSRIIGVKCDVTKDEDVKQAVEFVKNRLQDGQQLWAVINNVGVFSTYGPAEWCSVDEYKSAMELNFYGMVRVSNAFTPLIRQVGGRIVCTSSVAGRLGTPGGSPYSSAKAAVNHWAEASALELRPFGVRVCIVEPGVFKTSLIDENAKRNRVNHVWGKLDQEVKAAWGEQFKEKFIDGWNKLMSTQGASDTSPVIDAYIHAVTAKYPRFRYQAGSNSKWVWGKLALLPTNWAHTLMPLLSRSDNVPAAVLDHKEEIR